MTSTSYLTKVFTVEDKDARIRRNDDLTKSAVFQEGDPLPPGKAVGDPKIIPVGTKVRIADVKIVDGTVFALCRPADDAAATPVWTSSRNFAGHFINETLGEVPPVGNDPKGPNAAWEHGKFIGQKTLVNIVDTDLQIEKVTIESLPAFQKLIDAAAAANVNLALRSGFRTFAQQVALHDNFVKNGHPKAAAPGASNHQHGQAFDLNVSEFDGNPIYDWLKKNAPGLGFIRTVGGEPWHWELRPAEAADLAKKGLFKRADVNP